MKSKLRTVLAFFVTIALLCVMFLYAVKTGSLDISWQEIFDGITGNGGETYGFVRDTRFPRILVALFGGAATAVAGALLQAVMKNPLADPGILGISTGAGLLAVVLPFFIPVLYLYQPLVAFAGGLISFALVYSLSWKSGLSPLRIILVGVAVSTMFSALSSAFMTAVSGNGGVSNIVSSNYTQVSWSDTRMLGIYTAVGLVAAMLSANQCNLLSLSDQTAASLGVHVNRSRLIVSVVAVLLASITTAVIGPISFLGLIIPHLGRRLVGSNHKVLIPYCVFAGALVFLAADTVGRLIASPNQIDPTVIMSVVGGPFFILQLRRSEKTYGT